MTAVASSHWVLLWSANPETHVRCLTTKDRVSADVLQVHAEDLQSVVAGVRTDERATSASQSTQSSFFPGHP
jgi:hypothetical protein